MSLNCIHVQTSISGKVSTKTTPCPLLPHKIYNNWQEKNLQYSLVDIWDDRSSVGGGSVLFIYLLKCMQRKFGKWSELLQFLSVIGIFAVIIGNCKTDLSS